MKIENLIGPMTGLGAGMIGANIAKTFAPRGNMFIRACTSLATICIADVCAVGADNHARTQINAIRNYFNEKEETEDVRVAETDADSESSAT